jgi:hypothetical protein
MATAIVSLSVWDALGMVFLFYFLIFVGFEGETLRFLIDH